MLFNSLSFLVFFMIVTALFFAVPQRAKNVVLLIFSYIFYMWWDVKLVSLILFTTLVSYAAGRLMDNYGDKKKPIMAVSVCLVFAVLIFFKYYNFLASGVSSALGVFTGKGYDFHLDILLPVGISFYTFQTVSYIVDVYRGKFAAEKNILDFALFISFCPQLVAGPIERPGDLLPQLKAEHRFDKDNFISGIRLMVIGFFEKIAVADMLGVLVNRAYEDINNASGAAVLTATLLFCAQILCDFKGYSDIARGIARVYGIRLSVNFDHPYSAQSVKEFWNRWHITLSSWFRDYVYFPLGGGRVGSVRRCFNILIVFLLSGLWHGADITFVLWGLMLALWRIGESIVRGRNFERKTGFYAAVLRTATFTVIALSWVMFRSNGITDAVAAYSSLFSNWEFSQDYFVSVWQYFDMSALKAAFGAASLILFLTYEKLLGFTGRQGAGSGAKICRVAVFTLMMWLTVGSFIVLNAADIESSFIYFQF